MANLHIDENAIMELVSKTHNPDGTNFDTNVVLDVAENILNLKTATDQEGTEEKLKKLPLNLRQLCLEIAHKWLSTTNGHLATICVLSMLSVYHWEAKLVLMIAAFSINYGKLDIVSRFSDRKRLAKGLAILKQVKEADDQKPLDDSIKCILDLGKCMVELKQPSSYSPPQSVISALPIACYWIGRSIAFNVAYCAAIPLTSILLENELAIISSKIKGILATCCPPLEAKKEEDSYKTLHHALSYGSSHQLEVLKLILNVKDNDEPALARFSFIVLGEMKLFPRRKYGLNIYKEKNVILLITSGLDISHERINFLNDIYLPYILWIPMVDDAVEWTAEQFTELAAKMEFMTVDDPQKRIARGFTRFVKEDLFPTFQIGEEPIMISLDRQGKIVHTNALHMILIWDSDYIEERTTRVLKRDNVIPFVKEEMKERTQGLDSLITDIEDQISDLAREVDGKINAWVKNIDDRIWNLRRQSNMYTSERETTLWQRVKAWSLGLVVGETDDDIKDWIANQESYIFLYGGNDIEWIRQFTSKVHEISSKNQSNIQLAYVGRNEMVRETIAKERLSYLLHNSYIAWWFWTRLRSVFLSRINYLKASSGHGDECNDEIAQGLKKLLAYEGKGTIIEGWAILSKGENIIVCGRGAKILRVLNEYENWIKNIARGSFGQAFKDYYCKMFSSSSCSMISHPWYALEFPTTSKETTEKEKCPECSHCMHKFVTFTCYHGDN